jgi:DNA-directed RNA polymerase subunit RPC12/RpoP
VIPPGHVVLDTSGLAFVNSVGLREWIWLIRTLRDRGVITLVRVAEVLMAHMNVVREFAQSVRIASFHAAYVCDACGAETTPLIDVMQHGALLAAMQAPRMQCQECGGGMELADFPERYLTIFKA